MIRDIKGFEGMIRDIKGFEGILRDDSDAINEEESSD